MVQTVREYNIAKAQFCLQHHPDCEGATSKLCDDGLIVTSPTGVQILVGEKVDWLRDTDGNVLSQKLRSFMGVFLCLQSCYRTVDTLVELEDMMRELYMLDNLDGMGTIDELMREALINIRLDLCEKIGFRPRYGNKLETLEAKVVIQLRNMVETGDWAWGTLNWYPLRELTLLVDPTPDSAIVLDRAGPVEGAKGAMFEHFKGHEGLGDRYAGELLRRIKYLDVHGQWPKIDEA